MRNDMVAAARSNWAGVQRNQQPALDQLIDDTDPSQSDTLADESLMNSNAMVGNRDARIDSTCLRRALVSPVCPRKPPRVLIFEVDEGARASAAWRGLAAHRWQRR